MDKIPPRIDVDRKGAFGCSRGKFRSVSCGGKERPLKRSNSEDPISIPRNNNNNLGKEKQFRRSKSVLLLNNIKKSKPKEAWVPHTVTASSNLSTSVGSRSQGSRTNFDLTKNCQKYSSKARINSGSLSKKEQILKVIPNSSSNTSNDQSFHSIPFVNKPSNCLNDNPTSSRRLTSRLNNNKINHEELIELDLAYEEKKKSGKIPGCPKVTSCQLPWEPLNRKFEVVTESKSKKTQEGDEVQVYTFRTTSVPLKTNQCNKEQNDLISKYLEEKRQSRLSSSKSLDLGTKPNYTGYKPLNGICFVPFKSMFTKPKSHSSSESDISCLNINIQDNENFDKSKNKLNAAKCFSSCSWTNIQEKLELENSAKHFSKQDEEMLHKTREKIKEQLQVVEDNKRKNVSRKIKVNIFLSSQVENASTEKDAPEDTEETIDHRHIQEKEAPNQFVPESQQPSPVADPCLDFSSSGSTKFLSSGESNVSPLKLKPNEDLRPVSSNDKQLTIEPYSQLEPIRPVSGKVKTKKREIQTLMSLQCASPMMTNEFDLNINSPKFNNFFEKSFEPIETKNAEEINNTFKEPQGNFLKTIINGSRGMRTVKKIPLRESPNDPIGIQTEYEKATGLMPEGTSNLQISRRKNDNRSITKRKGGMQGGIGIERSMSMQSCFATGPEDQKEPFVINIQGRIDNYNENVMQAFRKKVEESHELHRRLHFCGVKVSKETVMRALMSPSQIKMYEQLHHCS